jgi:hypothetical protein
MMVKNSPYLDAWTEQAYAIQRQLGYPLNHVAATQFVVYCTKVKRRRANIAGAVAMTFVVVMGPAVLDVFGGDATGWLVGITFFAWLIRWGWLSLQLKAAQDNLRYAMAMYPEHVDEYIARDPANPPILDALRASDLTHDDGEVVS